MKKSLIFLFILSSSLFAQEGYISLGFDELVQKPCPFDSSVVTYQLENWIIYQTHDSTWNGEIDSSLCISLQEDRGLPSIRVADIDKTRPIFFRYVFSDSTKPWLFSDHSYLTYGQIVPENDAFLRIGVDCPGDLCTGYIVGIDIPNETGDGRSMRNYKMAYYGYAGPSFGTCVPIEKFQDNYLGEFIYKLFIQEHSSNNGFINLYWGGMEVNPYTGRIYNVMVDEQYKFNGRYQIYVGELSENMDGFGSHMLMYERGDQYPSFANPHYIEAQPVPNTDEIEIIDIDMGYETLISQPFTYLRGALIEGSDSLRHEVNLINDGGELCVLYIEVLFEDNTHYYHKGGTINMDGRTACLLFQRGSSMNISSGAYLEYGKLTGDGAIALGRDGHLNLEKNSTMIVNNRFVIMEKSLDDQEQAYVDLQQGSKLIFGKTATLEKNTAFEDGKMMLNVYMNGGMLDDSQLSEEEKRLINRIYPEESSPLFEKIHIYPNPVFEQLWVDIPMEENGEVKLELIDLNGRLVKRYESVFEEGNQTLKIDIPLKLGGVYLLKVSIIQELTENLITKKIILAK